MVGFASEKDKANPGRSGFSFHLLMLVHKRKKKNCLGQHPSIERPALSRTYMRSYNPSHLQRRLRVVPIFPQGSGLLRDIVERAKRERAWKITPSEKGETRGERKKLSPSRLAFLAWDDFHARSTIPEEKWGLLVVCLQRELPCISFNGQSTTSTYMSSTNLKLSDTTAVKWQASCSLEPCTWRTVCIRTTFTLFFYKISSKI